MAPVDGERLMLRQHISIRRALVFLEKSFLGGELDFGGVFVKT